MLPPRIHLASNDSTNYFPNNTSSNFIVKIPPHIFDSKTSKNVECALSQINFPNTYKNVRDGLNGISIYKVDKDNTENVQFFKIPAGYYSSLNHLFHTIKGIVPPLADDAYGDKSKFAIGYDAIRQRSWVRVSQEFYVEFQLDIAKFLGFDANVKIKRDTKEKRRQHSRYHPQVHGGLSTIFVYCDIIEHQLIGETSAPLLRILNWNHASKKLSISQTFSELFYVPIKSSDFDTIHIYLLDSLGYPISFENGHTFAVMEFREKTVKHM